MPGGCFLSAQRYLRIGFCVVVSCWCFVSSARVVSCLGCACFLNGFVLCRHSRPFGGAGSGFTIRWLGAIVFHAFRPAVPVSWWWCPCALIVVAVSVLQYAR